VEGVSSGKEMLGGLRRAGVGVLLLVMLAAAGCAAERQPAPPVELGSGGAEVLTARDRERLAALGRERTGAAPEDGYRIGPDDLLEIRIPDLIAADQKTADTSTGSVAPLAEAPVFRQGIRVDARGDVSLPLLGVVHVEGLSPTALEAALGQRLQAAGLLRHPQVSVQIVEYRSRVVAVVGSVERPGLYPVTRPRATLADMVWAAGGPNRDAGRVVEFVPAGTQTNGGGQPVRLDLQGLLHPAEADARLLELPVRAGDLISLAPAGSVMVDGWVQKPGSYPLTRGLTLTGAVAAAGGHLFPADRRHVTVKRVLGADEQRSFTVDLQEVAEGHQRDIPMLDGDTVRLPSSPARLVPWGVWSFAREVIRVGGNVLLF
jgi:polysaccharide export outer membrane protein